ncbi:hypothetical protein A0H81_04824 [Grifola frondosa]|uniref:Uncharacterized protein n=1 Tax=Grifola frondosa TaxID=5627 RepID=A0A1C7MFI7_GRIFR|nr:hypothetical protein A0H81_04824 [Grifola frondosa]
MPLMSHLFKRHKNGSSSDTNLPASADDDIVTRTFAKLTLGESRKSTGERPAIQPNGGFVGGFSSAAPQLLPKTRTSNDSDAVPPRPPPGAGSVSFPVPAVYGSPGPLPRPPGPVMPVPQLSQTMQRALNGSPSRVKQSLRPPVAVAMTRPHSDSSVFSPSTPHRPHAVHAPSSAPAKPPSSHASPPVTPTRRPRASSTTATVQCSGITRAGKRCARPVKVGRAFVRADQDVDEEPQRYCFQHTKDLLKPSGFYTVKDGTWITFGDWIPEYLQPETQLLLRTEMDKARSDFDVNGYIYTFEIRDPNTPTEIHLKVGRTVSLVKRLDEWDKQCGSKEQILRGFWPGTIEAEKGSLMKGRVRAGEPGRWCHRVERLVHLELTDLALNVPYLDPRFPNINAAAQDSKSSSGSSTPSHGSASARKRCADCGAVHKEIFSFLRAERGFYKGKEWESIVKPVIEKWGAFVDAYV